MIKSHLGIYSAPQTIDSIRWTLQIILWIILKSCFNLLCLLWQTTDLGIVCFAREGREERRRKCKSKQISLYESWPQICFLTASESGEMSVGLLFFLYNFSRKFLEQPAYSAKKYRLWVVFMEIIETDLFSLGYQGAVSNIFKGNLAFFQERCCIWFTAVPMVMPAQLRVHLSSGSHLQESASLGSLILKAGRGPAPQLSFLSVSDVHRVHVSWLLFVKEAFKHVSCSCSIFCLDPATHLGFSKSKSNSSFM